MKKTVNTILTFKHSEVNTTPTFKHSTVNTTLRLKHSTHFEIQNNIHLHTTFYCFPSICTGHKEEQYLGTNYQTHGLAQMTVCDIRVV